MLRSNSIASSFLTAPFLLLFAYCCLLQYQFVQLSFQLQALLPQQRLPNEGKALDKGAVGNGELGNWLAPLSTSAKPPSDSIPPFRVEDLLRLRSPPPRQPPQLSEEEERKIQRSIYGGKNDPVHLGGFTVRDNDTISTNLWNFMMSELAVKSVIDVGCGRGYSAKHFLDNGARVTCVEGSRDAVRNTLLPHNVIVNHDFSLGPWWPEQTFDVAWSTEFVEHVGRQYMQNYFPIFKKSAFVMITTVGWGGWHHVEIHAPWWWISKMQTQGFVFADRLTEVLRGEAERDSKVSGQPMQSVRNVLVFINPAVANLPQHRHLMGGKGCDGGAVDNLNGGTACTGVDALPAAYESLIDCTRELSDSIAGLWKCARNNRANEVH